MIIFIELNDEIEHSSDWMELYRIFRVDDVALLKDIDLYGQDGIFSGHSEKISRIQ